MAQLSKLFERLPLPLVPPNLKIGREIDRGAWGAVHERQLEGTSVAIKKIRDALKDAENGDDAVHSFFEDCERLKTVDHPHVIKFLGAFKDAELGPVLVMERMNENLRHFLERHRGRLTIQGQIRISHEITQGLAFLHQLTPPMVHRDLNDKNVMFTFDGVAKIGDFGQSCLKQDLYLTSDQPGMVIFMPPEALGDGNSKYDESLDIFSLGVLMLEIATQQQPVPSITGIGTIPEIERREKRIQKLGDLHPLKPFIVLCLSDDRKKRPTATEMQTVLGRLEENILQTMLVTERTIRKIEADKTICENAIRQLLERCERLDAQVEISKQVEECARIAEADNQRLQRELAEKQEHERKMTSDLQVTREQLTATDAEKHIIQTELDRVKQNEDQAIKAVAETQRREALARQQLETELRMARDHLRMVNGEKQSVQMELDRVKEALQEAQDHVSARALREESIQREHANSLEKTLATEKRAKDEFIAQMRYQLEIFEGRSKGVQHLGQSKEPSDAQRHSTMRQKSLAANDGSKHPVLDQQEIDKQLPKAAADATPKVLTFANIRLKEPIVVTPKSVAAPVVIPEAPIDVDTRKPPAVIPEEPVVATPMATSAAPAKTAPSTNPKETPNATPNEAPVPAPTSSIATPKVPVATSVAPVNIPSAHVATSVAPVGIPRAPVTPPRAPVATPRVPVATSVAPVDTPSAPVAMPRAPVHTPRAPVATSIAHVDTPSAPHTMPKSPTVTTPKSPATDPSANQQQQVDNRAIPSKGNVDQSEVGGQGPGEKNTHSTEQDSDTQDANMKDAPSCEKCGKIFPWNQRHLLWKHMQECTGSTESGERVSKLTPLVARSQTLPRSTQMRYTGPSTTSGSGESDTQAAATDEDAPKCEKCGRTFPWNQLQLRWKHKCEPTEVARAPDPPRRRVKSSAFNLKRPVSVANIEELFTSSTVEVGVRSASDDATLTCRCGKIFTENQRREFVIHKLQCREGTPPVPPSTGRHYRGATLPRQ